MAFRSDGTMLHPIERVIGMSTPSYELFFHGPLASAVALGPEARPLPFWFKAGFGAVVSVVAAIGLAFG